MDLNEIEKKFTERPPTNLDHMTQQKGLDMRCKCQSELGRAIVTKVEHVPMDIKKEELLLRKKETRIKVMKQKLEGEMKDVDDIKTVKDVLIDIRKKEPTGVNKIIQDSKLYEKALNSKTRQINSIHFSD